MPLGSYATDRAYAQSIRLHFINPGEPSQDAYLERFTGRLRVLRRRICPCDSPSRRHGAGDFGRSAPGSLEPDTSVVGRWVNQLT